jgi:hypothetical protein
LLLPTYIGVIKNFSTEQINSSNFHKFKDFEDYDQEFVAKLLNERIGWITFSSITSFPRDPAPTRIEATPDQTVEGKPIRSRERPFGAPVSRRPFPPTLERGIFCSSPRAMPTKDQESKTSDLQPDNAHQS